MNDLKSVSFLPASLADKSTTHLPTATDADIFYCFRLLLGRLPQREEWPGHSQKVGDDLVQVVRSYANSLECANLGIFGAGAVGETTLSEIEGFRMFTSNADSLIGGGIRHGEYEPEVCAIFRKFLRPGMTVLDIGANVGFFSMLSASIVGPSGFVFAVEPNRNNAVLMEASRRVNGFENLQILQVAASDQIGLLALNSSYSNGTTSGTSSDVAILLSSTTVPAVPLGPLLPGRKIDFIKVDVEGAEYLALRGLADIIKRDKPVIISEFSPPQLEGISGVSGWTFLSWLAGIGYSLSVVNKDGTYTSSDVDGTMRAWSDRGTDHIDILATAS